jgi:hypothetical protein
MNAAKVVMHVVDRQRRDMILDLFRKRIGQSGKPAYMQSQGQILALHKSCADVFRIGVPD